MRKQAARPINYMISDRGRLLASERRSTSSFVRSFGSLTISQTVRERAGTWRDLGNAGAAAAAARSAVAGNGRMQSCQKHCVAKT